MTRLIMVLAALLACACGSSQEHAAEPADLDPPTQSDSNQNVEPVAEAEPPPQEPAQPSGPLSIDTPPDVAAPPADAEVSPSGLASRRLRAGTGTAHPGPTDRVTVHYVGWTTDGQRFDSSVERGAPTTFPLNRVIAGWTEGVQLMVEGERRRFWIPANLAYGDNPRPGAPSGMLVFDVELIRIER